MAQITVNESAGDFTHVVKLTFAQLKSIGSGNSKSILILPAGSAVDLVGIVETVAIAGSSSLLAEVGYTGATDAFIASLDLSAQAVNTPVFNTGSDFVKSAATTTIKGGSLPVKIVSADTTVSIKVTDAALASVTAGEIVIGFRVINLTRFR